MSPPTRPNIGQGSAPYDRWSGYHLPSWRQLQALGRTWHAISEEDEIDWTAKCASYSIACRDHLGFGYEDSIMNDFQRKSTNMLGDPPSVRVDAQLGQPCQNRYSTSQNHPNTWRSIGRGVGHGRQSTEVDNHYVCTSLGPLQQHVPSVFRCDEVVLW